VNPGRSRRCKEENALSWPLSLDGKVNADDDSKSEDLPCIEVREATSDRPHAVLLCYGKRMKAFPPGKVFYVSGMQPEPCKSLLPARAAQKKEKLFLNVSYVKCQ